MSDVPDMTAPDGAETSLIVRRRIAAPADRLFAAWTESEQIMRWWGPAGVTCEAAEVDLRVGGRYRIANRLPDDRLLLISGVFEAIERPRRLVYSWTVEPGYGGTERVTVRFAPGEDAGNTTDVTIVHERVGDAEARATHEAGWRGCLDGLARYLGGDAAP